MIVTRAVLLAGETSQSFFTILRMIYTRDRDPWALVVVLLHKMKFFYVPINRYLKEHECRHIYVCVCIVMSHNKSTLPFFVCVYDENTHICNIVNCIKYVCISNVSATHCKLHYHFLPLWLGS